MENEDRTRIPSIETKTYVLQVTADTIKICIVLPPKCVIKCVMPPKVVIPCVIKRKAR